jgi:hypothetical protein
MVVKIIDYVGRYHAVPGPHDLQKYGEGDTITLDGEISDMDKSTWCIAIGLFVIRGGSA